MATDKKRKTVKVPDMKPSKDAKGGVGLSGRSTAGRATAGRTTAGRTVAGRTLH